jgi:hypothetical protein
VCARVGEKEREKEREERGKFNTIHVMYAQGKDGQVAFVIYGPKGFEESGGFPYRLVFDTQDAAAITSIVGGLATKNRTEALVYGQEIEYGPVAPANVGELSSPACQLRTQFKLEDKIIDTIYGQKFEGLPKVSTDPGAATSERLGISKMDKSFYRNVQNTLVLPPLLLISPKNLPFCPQKCSVTLHKVYRVRVVDSQILWNNTP